MSIQTGTLTWWNNEKYGLSVVQNRLSKIDEKIEDRKRGKFTADFSRSEFDGQIIRKVWRHWADREELVNSVLLCSHPKKLVMRDKTGIIWKPPEYGGYFSWWPSRFQELLFITTEWNISKVSPTDVVSLNVFLLLLFINFRSRNHELYYFLYSLDELFLN